MADQGGSPNWMQLLQALSPTAEYADQDKAIQEQLAQAYAMRNREQSQHSTGAGAFLGGIGDILNRVNGQKDVNAQQQQQQKLWNTHQTALSEAIKRLGGPQQMQGAGSMAPPVDY